MKTIRDFDVNNKRVLVRAGFDVPLDEKGGILDDFRVQKSLPTIRHLIERDAKVILISHLGRPQKAQSSKLKTQSHNLKLKTKQKFSLRVVALRLGELLNMPVKFIDDCVGDKVEQEVGKMSAGEIILLENLRFYNEETEGSAEFAEKLARLGDVFIQDGFSVCHREHSSITGIPKFLPSAMGFLVEQEIKILSELLEQPQRPLIVIMGGAKAKTKIKALNKISEIADQVLIGHLIEKEISRHRHNERREFSRTSGARQSIPVRHCEERGSATKQSLPQKIIAPIDSLRANNKDLDIGAETIDLFARKILKAKTIFWNGPLGDINDKRFTDGSLEIAKAIIASRAYSIVGGGDTVGFLHQNNLRDKFNFVSTGGGAMLAFLAGSPLPGLSALK